MSGVDYWEDCIAEAFHDAEIEATEDQRGTVVAWVEGCHDNFSIGSGNDCIPNPLQTELDGMKRAHDDATECARRETEERLNALKTIIRHLRSDLREARRALIEAKP